MTKYLPLLTMTLCLSGCGVAVVTGPTQRESHAIERDSAKSLHTELRMGAGTLKVAGGAANWMQGDFAYNVASWKPNIRYTSGDLLIEQPNGGGTHTGSTTNDWDVRLNNDIPTDLSVRMGAGEARLGLGTLSLRSLEIDMGAGQLRLDLRGTPKSDYDVRVRGGAGEATVYLPKDVGIRATATGGLGEVKVQGLREVGGHWVNDAAGTAKTQIHLDIKGGVGSISLIAE